MIIIQNKDKDILIIETSIKKALKSAVSQSLLSSYNYDYVCELLKASEPFKPVAYKQLYITKWKNHKKGNRSSPKNSFSRST